MYFIYETINLANGKTYVGQHKGELDDHYLGSGSVLRRAIEKYGKENFKRNILEIVSEENVNQKEIEYIKQRKAEGKAEYNISGGGQACSNPLEYMPEEKISLMKQKMSKTRKGRLSGSAFHTWKKRIKTKIKTNPNQKRDTTSWKEKKKIICISDNHIFNSIKEAANFYNLDTSAI